MSNMSRAQRIDHIQISVRTTTSGHVAAAPVSKLCGLTSNCTRGCRRVRLLADAQSSQRSCLCTFHQTMPSISVLSIQLCRSFDHGRNSSCPRRCRNYPPFLAARIIMGCAVRIVVTSAERCLLTRHSNSNVFPGSSFNFECIDNLRVSLCQIELFGYCCDSNTSISCQTHRNVVVCSCACIQRQRFRCRCCTSVCTESVFTVNVFIVGS